MLQTLLMPLLRPLLLDPTLLLMMLPMMLLLLLPLLRSSCRRRPPASITPHTLAAIHPHSHLRAPPPSLATTLPKTPLNKAA